MRQRVSHRIDVNEIGNIDAANCDGEAAIKEVLFPEEIRHRKTEVGEKGPCRNNRTGLKSQVEGRNGRPDPVAVLALEDKKPRVVGTAAVVQLPLTEYADDPAGGVRLARTVGGRLVEDCFVDTKLQSQALVQSFLELEPRLEVVL